MRKIANIKNAKTNIKRLMIFNSAIDTYLFLYDKLEDNPCMKDLYFDNIEEAEEFCYDEYNINKNDWKIIEEPQEGCQHDWIESVRVKGNDLGKPLWGKFEKWIDGKWVDITE